MDEVNVGQGDSEDSEEEEDVYTEKFTDDSFDANVRHVTGKDQNKSKSSSSDE